MTPIYTKFNMSTPLPRMAARNIYTIHNMLFYLSSLYCSYMYGDEIQNQTVQDCALCLSVTISLNPFLKGTGMVLDYLKFKSGMVQGYFTTFFFTLRLQTHQMLGAQSVISIEVNAGRQGTQGCYTSPQSFITTFSYSLD